MRHFALGPGSEFDHIRAIVGLLGDRVGQVGDDCAIVRRPDGFLVLSTDLSIERHHFQREWLSLEEVGWRAAASGLSDLAAEGAEPLGLLASVAVPKGEAGATERIMAGVGALAADAGTIVLGGDLSAGPAVIVDVVAVGHATRPITRAGAVPGDGLWVTGTLGGARAALDAWRDGREPAPAAREQFARPVPRLAAGRWLAAHGVRAMIDLSDGLAGDARHLAAASEVGLRIKLEQIPVDPSVVSEIVERGVPAQCYAAEGGEDYELLAALPPEFGTAEAQECQRSCGVVLTRIGDVVAGSAVRFTFAGVPQQLDGFDHFA